MLWPSIPAATCSQVAGHNHFLLAPATLLHLCVGMMQPANLVTKPAVCTAGCEDGSVAVYDFDTRGVCRKYKPHQ